jgi:hypothetical protein
LNPFRFRQATAAGRRVDYALITCRQGETMFEDERRRRQQQINREKAERYAVIVAVITQNAAAQRAREQRRAVRRTRASVAKPA